MTDDFSPVAFLSTLHNRHQTLEDLRAELRTRSQELSKELLELVNANYQGFLNLGTSLQGGEEKVEQLKVGLLRFKKEVEGISSTINGTEREVKQLIEQRTSLKKQVRLGKTLLSMDGMIEDLEIRLMMGSRGTKDDEDHDDLATTETEDSSDEGEVELDTGETGFISSSRLARHVQDYLCIKHLSSTVGTEHPFIVAQEHRLARIRNTILLDMGTALKSIFAHRGSRDQQVIKMMNLYKDMEAPKEAIRIIKQSRAEKEHP